MASKKQSQEKNNTRVQKAINKINKTFTDFMNDFRLNYSGADINREEEMTRLNSELEKIINTELSDMNNFTGQDISTFLYKLLNEYDRDNQRSVKNVEDIFTTADSQTVIQFFYERYKNRNLLYEDLNVINEQLFQMNEAVLATRDAIITADDMSRVVSRQLNFKNVSNRNNETDGYVSIVETMEKEHKLLLKLKDHIIPKTLTYGNYYVYTIPYSKLFEMYYKKKKTDEMNNYSKSVKENLSTIELVEESFINDFKKEYNVNGVDSKKIVKEVNDFLSNIEIYNSDTAIPIVEGVDLSVFSSEDFMKTVKDVTKPPKTSKREKNHFSDGTVEFTKKETDFSNVSGCYIRLLDPRRVIPVKILDNVLGYYYLHEPPAQIKTTFTTNITIGPATSKMFSSSPEQMEHQFLSQITDRIVKSFDRKFLESNKEFKDLIFNAIRYNDLYKKQLKFEFIPKEYITEFKVNEDENGNGTSVLYRSLFYAKLYLAMLIFKLIMIVTRSPDTRVFYVKQSGMDQDITNSLQSAARAIKERQINFMDLLSYQSIVSKVGHMKDVFMPVG